MHKQAIGIIEGEGVGVELSNYFQKIIDVVCQHNKKTSVEFISFKQKYNFVPNSFLSLKNSYKSKSSQELHKSLQKDESCIEDFIDYLAKQKVKGIFRAAINAESLYQIRQKLRIIKALSLDIKKHEQKKKLIFIRDQLQGYYANNETLVSHGLIQTHANFASNNFDAIMNFTKKYLQRINIKPDLLLFIYKYHLFGFHLEEMITNSVKDNELSHFNYRIYQPDSGIHFLLKNIFQEKDINNIAVICGNEVGDMLLETLIHYYNLGNYDNTFTNNYLLNYDNLEMLQTMHGSADLLKGSFQVNPIATIKAAAYALENWLDIPKMSLLMSEAIQQVKSKVSPSDASYNSQHFVNLIIKQLLSIV